jgi:hypothetical protein
LKSLQQEGIKKFDVFELRACVKNDRLRRLLSKSHTADQNFANAGFTHFLGR